MTKLRVTWVFVRWALSVPFMAASVCGAWWSGFFLRIARAIDGTEL